MTALLGLYRAGTTLFGPISGLYLRRRVAIGKEDAGRLNERRGISRMRRPQGPLIWVHGASVGEGLALLPLIERLVARGAGVLVTTGTVTSARILAGRLPAGAFHQFVPLDVPAAMGRFVDHWQPALALLAESELWPNLIVETHRRGIPLALVNARLSKRSFERWRLWPRLIGSLLGYLSLCVAQSATDADRFRALGMRAVEVAGNLKFDAEAPPAAPEALDALRAAIGQRPVWLAASTHADEDDLLIAVHRRLTAARPDLLTVMVPRQAHRGPEIADKAAAAGVARRRRAAGELPEPDTQLYIADTMGELGLFYRAIRLVFVGKSLGAAGGGQNPLEPAKLGCAVLHGPAVSNFTDIYRQLDDAGGARQVADVNGLADAVTALISDQTALDAMGEAARRSAESGAGATDRILLALAPLLDRALRPAPRP